MTSISKLNETPVIPAQETKTTAPISFRANDYERIPDEDSVELSTNKNKTNKKLLLGLGVAALAAVGIIGHKSGWFKTAAEKAKEKATEKELKKLLTEEKIKKYFTNLKNPDGTPRFRENDILALIGIKDMDKPEVMENVIKLAKMVDKEGTPRFSGLSIQHLMEIKDLNKPEVMEMVKAFAEMVNIIDEPRFNAKQIKYLMSINDPNKPEVIKMVISLAYGNKYLSAMEIAREIQKLFS